MKSVIRRCSCTAASVALLAAAHPAAAQPLGSFSWQLQPFCNVVTMAIVQVGGLYTLSGQDDQCGGANPVAPLDGVVTFNPDGSLQFGINVVTTPGASSVHVAARLVLPNLNGTWSDSAGNSGTFAFNGSAGGSPRPTPTGLSVSALAVAGSATLGGSLSAQSLTAQGGFMQATSFNNIASGAPSLDLTRGRGAVGAISYPLLGDRLGTISFKGVTNPAGGFRSGALIQATATQTWSFTGSGASLSFSTNPNSSNTTVVRMFIDHNGEVGIGTTVPDQLLTVNGNASKASGGTTWAVFSDERLKTIRGTYPRGLTELLALEPIRYEYRPGNPLGLATGTEQVGFSAQAVQRVIPEAVSVSGSGYLQLSADPILWTMVNAVKELKGENDALKVQNAALDARLAAVEAAIKKP